MAVHKCLCQRITHTCFCRHRIYICWYEVLWLLFDQDKEEEAREILARIYPEDEVEGEMEALRASVESEREMKESEGNLLQRLKDAWGNKVVRRGLYAGVTVQVAQQFVGINTVMYYSPTIVQYAGYASNKTALALSLVTSGLNAVGSVISMFCVDKYGRRKLMIISMFGIIVCLVILSAIFFRAASTSPSVSTFESESFGKNSTCPAYVDAPDPSSWDCTKCLEYSGCAFCSNKQGKVSVVSSPFQVSCFICQSVLRVC